MGLLALIFGKSKPLPMVIIRNRLGKEIDRVEGVRDLWGQDLRGRQWRTLISVGCSWMGSTWRELISLARAW
jgi:hypothetical protein